MMKQISGYALLFFVVLLMLGNVGNLRAQEKKSGKDTSAELKKPQPKGRKDSGKAMAADTGQADTTASAGQEAASGGKEKDQSQNKTFHQVVKDYFIEGNWVFMSFVLAALIFGLAISIERIITLNLSTINSKRLLNDIDQALARGGVEEAQEVTKSRRGPIASIMTQGLMRISEGIDMVEKSIVSYGSVQMGRLEKGMVWISLFIAIAPMMGFMGTVIGMIQAFDDIASANTMSPDVVATGIKTALLTTVAGLIVAVILQVFYNYCVSKIDSLVNEMEDSSIALVDLLVKHGYGNPKK